MIVVALATWMVFCLRDYSLLRAAVADGAARRIRSWFAMVAVMATAAAFSLARFGTIGPVIVSPVFLEAAVSCHLLCAVWCIGAAVRRNYAAAWWAAAAPAPASWILLVLAVNRISGSSAAAIALLEAIVLISIAAGAITLRPSKLNLYEDITFTFRFAQCTNCLALCLVPLIGQVTT